MAEPFRHRYVAHIRLPSVQTGAASPRKPIVTVARLCILDDIRAVGPTKIPVLGAIQTATLA
jgi:hypothetical protein